MSLVDLFIQEVGREPTGNVQDEVRAWAEQQIKDYLELQQLTAKCFQRNNELITERDALAERAEEAEALAIEWQQKHADLYIDSEEARNRANDAEGKLIVLQDLLQRAAGIAGGDDMAPESFDDELTLYAGNVAAQSKYWRNE